jgi:PRTRC genetic system protein B
VNKNLQNTKLNPNCVLIVYRSAGKYNEKYFIEKRDVTTVGGKQILSAAVPLSDDVMKKIALSYAKEEGTRLTMDKLIPEFLLHGSNDITKKLIVWYRPAMKRSLNFSGNHELNKLKHESAMVPATLYVLHNKELYVFALPNNQRPTEKTKLYNSPFYNVYSDGKVCRGTAQFSKATNTFSGEIERYERGFYMAEQGGMSNEKATKKPLRQIWASLLGTNNSFPVKELIQHTKFKTLGDLITKLS